MSVLIYVYPARKLRQIPKCIAQRFLSAAGVGRAIADQSYPGLPKKANEWTDTLLQSYQINAIAHFRRQELDFISVSLDGTRLGKREVLLTALCAPETGGTFWCPPRAESLAASEKAHFRPPKHTFQASETGRLKTHKNVENGRRKTHQSVENGCRKTHLNA